MKTKQSAWVRTWIVVSVLWGAVLIGLTVRLLASGPSFAEATSEHCPQLLLRPAPVLEKALLGIHPELFFKIVIWRDARTGAELSTFRKGEQALSCGTLEARAKIFQVAAQSGLIQPQVHLRTKLLALIIVISALLLAPIVYLSHLPFAKKAP
jgi:hypothetical protein